MTKRYIVLTVVLVLAGLIVAAGLFWSRQARQEKSAVENIPKPVFDELTGGLPDSLPTFLSEKDQDLLTPLPANPTSAIYSQKYYALVNAAKLGNKIEIKECFGVPTVLKIIGNKETTITFKNTDAQKHAIYLQGKQYLLPANRSINIIARNNKIGVYGYKCDNFTRFTGFIYVAEK